MISVKGKFKNGVALPLEPVKETHKGQSVIITFLDEEAKEFLSEKKNGAKTLEDLIAECEVDTGIEDLAAQHDNYIYKEKKDLTENKIDDLVIKQAENEDAWENPIYVKKENRQI